ncbi:hypothetical protein C8Q72DRAFT_785030, partial [Fomitopsis betulina]
IILDPGIKETLLNDARDFFSSKKWYTDRGIPFRRGYLLVMTHLAPGSGKTSMIQSIAGELGLNVYIVTLSRIGMDDSALNELISNMPRRCIALMEDIDAAFKAGITRDLPSEPQPHPGGDESKADSGRGLLNNREHLTRQPSSHTGTPGNRSNTCIVDRITCIGIGTIQ